MTQKELGEQLGRAVETLSRQENDVIPMSRADQLALLAIALGVRDLGGVAQFIEHEAQRSNRRSLVVHAA